MPPKSKSTTRTPAQTARPMDGAPGINPIPHSVLITKTKMTDITGNEANRK
jgi:hypothetical protein